MSTTSVVILYVILKIAIAVLILMALLLLVCGVAFYIMLVKPPVFDTSKPNKLMGDNFPALAERTADDTVKIQQLPHDDVTVTTDDGIELLSYFYKNSKPTDVTILCIHGYNSNGYYDYATRALAYLDAGYNVFIANLRHSNGNGGKYIGFGALERYDIIKFVKYINSVYPDGKIFVQGISMGGATVMQASSFDLTPNVKGIIDDCGFTTIKDEVKFVLLTVAHLPAFPLSNVLELYFKCFAKYDFTSSDSRREVAAAKVPMLFIHGDKDDFVPMFMGKECYEACTSEKEFVIIEGAGHAGAYFTNPDKYMKHLNAFISKNTEKQPVNK